MPTVVAKGLSKRYRIGEYRAGYETLRDTLSHTVRRALRLEHVDHSLEEIWALKDVSFAVEEGEVVGFIGRNGAGKSTLLKVLTRITPPTEGTATIRGRVGSILEVGTGFHPELDGAREHVPQRRDPRHEAPRDRREVRRDRRVQRHREVHRHAGQALLERHVRPPRVRRRRAPRSGGPHHRRGARGRRRRVPAALHGPDRGDLRARGGRCSSSRTTCRRSRGSATAPTGSQDGRVARRGAAEEVVAQYLQGASGAGAERVFEARRAHQGPRRPAARGARRRPSTARPSHAVDVREPIGIELDSPCLGRPARSSRRSSSPTSAGRSSSTRSTRTLAGATSPEPGTYTSPPGSRRTS